MDDLELYKFNNQMANVNFVQYGNEISEIIIRFEDGTSFSIKPHSWYEIPFLSILKK